MHRIDRTNQIIKKISKYFCFVGILLLCACSDKSIVYTDYMPVDAHGWTKNDTLHYNFAIVDTLAHYEIYLAVRHTEQYPYQNMWLFLNGNDTVEFYLADARGRWLGNHAGRLYEMPVILFEDYTFNNRGDYLFTIVHGMREDELRGVHDVGLIIKRKDDGGKK